jgi:transposase
MAWQPQTLTRAQMEERRLEGGRLLRAGKLSQAEIARHLGVSRATVQVWKKRLAAGGLRQLRSRRAGGRRPKLTAPQKKELLHHLKRGAQLAGYPTDRWTLVRIAEVIQRQFGVTYHPKYIGRLMRQLGWTPQVPLPRAVERDEDLIRAWLAHDWARIKKSAAARRRHRGL